MKTLPPLSKRPAVASAEELAARLRLADSVTMRPLQAAVDDAVGAAPATSTPAPAAPAAPSTPSALPWDAIDQKAVQPFSARLNARLYHQLRWLGETTYGSSMTKILHEALEAKVHEMLRERGITP